METAEIDVEQQIKKYAVKLITKTLFGMAIGTAAVAYTVGIIDTGSYNPLRAIEMIRGTASKEYREQYMQMKVAADMNGNGKIDSKEWDDIYKKAGSKFLTLKNLETAIQAYQDESEERISRL